MATSKDKRPINLRVSEIKKINHFENHFSKYGLTKDNLKRVGFKLGINIGVNSDNERISHAIKAVIYPEGKEEFELFGIESIYIYQIIDFKNVFQGTDENGYEIPDNFMSSLLGMTISGVRGMLAALNTVPEYNGIVLPPLNPTKVLEDYIKTRRIKPNKQKGT